MRFLGRILLMTPILALASCAHGSGSTPVEPKPSESKSSTVTSIEPPTSESDSSSSSDSSSASSTEAPVEKDKVDFNEAIASLKGRFSEPIETDSDVALSDLSAVGVDYRKFSDQTLYPVPTTGIQTYNVEDHGITTENENNSRALNDLIQSLRDVSGKKVIRFGSGTYKFGSTVSMTHLSDLYIVGQDTKWIMTNWGTYISASESTNIHINGITFDMDPSPTISGTILSYSYDSNGDCDVVVSVPTEFDLTKECYSNWGPNVQGHTTGSYMECVRDSLTGKYSPDSFRNLFYNSSGQSGIGMKSITLNPSRHQLTIKLSHTFPYCALKDPQIGTHVSIAFTMYDFFGFAWNDCEDIYMEHDTIHVTAGMGFRANGGKNMYLNHVHYEQDPNSERIMTCTADILHTCFLEGDFKVTNCLLESSHDDALNIKAFYGRISSVVKSSREITIEQTQAECVIRFEEGDVIDIFDPTTLAYIDTYTVESSVQSGRSFTVTVNRRPNNVVEGYSVGNDTKATHLYLHNSIIQNKRNRGILLQARSSEISNCTFHNIIHGPIQVLSVGDVFREAIAPKDIVIKNNKIINCKGTDINNFAYGTSGKSLPGSLKDIEITNNFFYGGQGNFIYSRSVDRLNAHHNLAAYPNLSNRTLISLYQTRDSFVEDNGVYVEGTNNNVTLVSEEECSGNTIANNRFLGGN